MTEHEEHDELTPEEIEEQNGEPLPDREAMSIITPDLADPPFTLPINPTTDA